jgi:hypothetical protein
MMLDKNNIKCYDPSLQYNQKGVWSNQPDDNFTIGQVQVYFIPILISEFLINFCLSLPY